MACPAEDYVQGWDRSQFSAMQSRGEVKPSLITAMSLQTECLRTRTVCMLLHDAFCEVLCMREVI